MIQLRIRTEYTFRRTFCPLPRAIQRLKEIECRAAGIVDGSSWGHVPWYKLCREANIKPLLGAEAVVSDTDETRRMWFLAKNTAGLSELYRALSRAYHTPVEAKFGPVQRLYFDDVRAMSADIFKFAGDITDGPFLKDVGAYLDVNPSSRIDTEAKRRIAREMDLPLVATSDNYFAYPDDKKIFEFASFSRIKLSPQYILDRLEFQDVAEQIASECDLTLPNAPMIRAEGNLEALCREGIPYRAMDWTAEYETRLNYELSLIREKQFTDYFIIVADMVRFAKRHMLVGPSRGSAAGSLVCYLTQITEIDPLPHKLYFERFIDITRVDLPDIDLDFPDDKRQLVFDYMAEKYGAGHIAHIGTISQFRPKSALVQVCKALNIPPKATAAIRIAMIDRSIADSRATNCLEDTLTQTEPGRAFARNYPEATIAQLLEGHASHTGTHAAGLLVCNDAITNYCIVDASGIAHCDKYSAETLGLLKIDVLGLRTLGILEDSGIKIDWYHLPFTDPATYKVFNDQRFCGIFQFEGPALRSVARLMKFKSLNEIDAATALARPGPFGGGVTKHYLERAQGIEQYTALHPLVEQQLNETFGLPIYQEQAITIVREIGKFDWKQTSFIRKAMSKSLGQEYFDSFFAEFKIGAASQGIPEQQAYTIWQMIHSMGGWAMNKAHTRSYAVISYWCAYLKAHHPLEFAAANLRSMKDEDSAIQLLREMVKEGIEYVPFDIQLSDLNWSVKDGKLVGGFMALKGIGESKGQKLVEKRNAGELTAKDIYDVNAAFNFFADIFPFQKKYASMYADPVGNNIRARELMHIGDIEEGLPEGHELVFIGEMFLKNARNANEEVEIKKRNGKVETGQLEYLDMRVRDDTGEIGCRIGRREYKRIEGQRLLEEVPVGAHLLIRAAFWKGYRYGFIKRWKWLDEPNGSKS